MKNYITFLFITVSYLAFTQNNQSTTVSKFTATLDEKIPLQLKEKNVPGMAIAIIEDGHIIYKKGIGFSNTQKQTKITSETGFNIGSISKLFTAWGIMKLVENNKINLDVPVENYLTRWKLPKSEFDSKKVTVRSLLSHTAGISVHGYPGFHPDAKLPTLEASLNGKNGPVRENEKVEIVIEPNTKFQYSGGGYTILQLLIEEVSGKSFEAYMQKEVFKPLKMKHTSFSITKKLLKNSATPYDANGKEVYIEVFTAKAAAGLHTTLEDMLLFAKATIEGNSVLTKQTINEMTKIVPITKTKGRGQGLGYNAIILGPLTVKGHAGSNTGWESGFMFDFTTNNGIIMLTNGDNGKDVAIATLREWARWKMNTMQSKN
ncbi:serine hydrolase domain-containing protein [Winogradskyella immobilis]|uniref:Beta-lactamase family protein n=1 Tax=Winogradskyella immobilis TaxID=2816852 RepID=A0ABS8EKI3_9FLAO|nr:serine hydrolase domain-containing protein [Winogradskyella immobilis]MCC1483531.1 beta-lactamase family protein [Winogradskyella immobilis]MCG0015625.1 beta-lactamase family protein [Winogradskyella immobilis]